MKAPEVVFKHDVMREELRHAPYGLTAAGVKTIVRDAIRLAERQAERGIDRVEAVLEESSREDMKRAWKQDALIVRYFGADRVTVENMKDVCNRLRRCHRRLSEKKLTVRVLPQSKAPDANVLAQNLGSVWSPKKFKVFASWFGKDEASRASIMIHELHHDLFLDQRIKHRGKRVPVYGELLAKKLARDHPAKARRSAENYELFCKAADSA